MTAVDRVALTVEELRVWLVASVAQLIGLISLVAKPDPTVVDRLLMAWEDAAPLGRSAALALSPAAVTTFGAAQVEAFAAPFSVHVSD